MPKFRAVVIYPEDMATWPKPHQVFGERRDLLEEWCRTRARKQPDGTQQPDGTEAVILETIERPVFRVRKRTDLAGEPTLDELKL